MDVIGHEAPGLDADAVVTGMLGEEIEVELSIGITEEDGLSEISAMADVVR